MIAWRRLPLIPVFLAAAAAAAPAPASDVAEDRSATLHPPSPDDRSAQARAEWGLGPIDFRDEFLVSLTHLSLAADSPATLDPGVGLVAVRADWAQTSVLHSSPPLVLDAETIEMAAIVKYGLAPRLEAGLEIPLLYRYGGVLDPVIRDVENFTGGARAERISRPDNVFAFRGETDEGDPFDHAMGLGLGKIRLSLKARLVDRTPEAPAVSIEAVVAFPTGSAGFEAHGVDAGLRLSAAKRLGDFVLYGGSAVVLLGRDRFGPIELKSSIFTGFGAVEFEIEPWLSAVYQLFVESPAVEDLHGTGFLLYHGGGLKARFNSHSGEIGILENGADVNRSADIAFHVAFGFRF